MDETAKKELKKNQITTKKKWISRKRQNNNRNVWNLKSNTQNEQQNPKFAKKKRPKSEKQMESG